MASEWLKEVEELKAAGFNDQEIAGEQSRQVQEMTDAGFAQKEIGAYFGAKDPDMAPMKRYFEENLKAHAAAKAEKTTTAARVAPPSPGEKQVEEADEFLEALQAGWQMSTTGLIVRGEAPTMVLPEHADMASRIASQVGTLAGDVPAMIAGALGGMAAGSAVGSAVPVVGTAAGALVGAGAGGNALPTAIRETLMSHYEKGDIQDFGDFWERSSAIFLETAKSGIVGGATAGVGGAVSKVAAPLASGLARGTAVAGSEIATMVTVGKALEGEIPKAHDFTDAALLVAGLTGSIKVAGKLRSMYAKTGVKPSEIVAQAEADPILKDQLVSAELDLPNAIEVINHDKVDLIGVNKEMVEVSNAVGDGGPARGLKVEPLPVKAEPPPNVKTVYHGTAAKFDELDFERGGGMVHFGEKPDVAHRYAEGGGGGRAALKDSQKYIVDGDGIVYEIQGAKEVEKTHRLSSGKELKFNVEEDGQWVAVGKYTGAGLVSEGMSPLTSEVPSLTRQQAEAMTQPGENLATVVPKHGRVIEKSIDMDRVLDATTPEGLQKLRKTLRPTNKRIEKFLKEIDNEINGEPGSEGFSNAFWNTTKAAKGDEIKANLREFSEQMKAAGFEGIRFKDDSHKTVAVFDNVGRSKPAAVKAKPALEPVLEPVAATELTAQEKVRSRIAVKPEAAKALDFDTVYTALVDDLHPMKQLSNFLSGGKRLPVKSDPYALARLTRGVFGKADMFLEQSPFEFDSLKNVGRPFKKIMEPVKQDLMGFREFAVASRTLELEARGVKTGVDLAAAQKTVSDGSTKYQKTFHELVEYQNHTLNYLKDSGILSPEAHALMLEANKSYVPFYRLMDEGGGGPKAGRGLQVKNPIKEIRGSERQIVDPIESIIKNTYTYITLAERNRVMRSLADLADANPELAKDVMVKVPKKNLPIEVKADEVAQFLADHGLDEAHAEAFTIFRPEKKALGPTEIPVFRDGKMQIYEVSPEVAKAVKALDRESLGLVTKILSLPARALRGGSTLSPEFMARNFSRDMLTAFNLGVGAFTPLDSLSGLSSLLKKDGHYENWMKSGGANAAMVSIDRAYISEKIISLEGETGLLKSARNVMTNPLHLLRVTGELIENSTRLGEFKRVTKGSTDAADVFKGGMAARDVTLDFARMGAKTRAMNMITAFWNAHVQGLDKSFRALKDRPMETGLKITASITAPSLLLWWANHDDPRWKEIPRWQKDLFWIVMTDDTIYRIPKPNELGIMFGSIPERVLEAYVEENPKAFKDLGDSLAGAFTPSYLPTFAVPVVEHFANRSTFTGAAIVPAQMEKILPEYQYSEYTSEVAKGLGKMIAAVPGQRQNPFASPQVIDNYVRAWSGNLGQYAMKLADQALYASGAVPDPVKPAATLADIPIIKAFVIRYPSASAQSIQDFYDRFEKSQTVINSVRHLAKSGDLDAMQKELSLEENRTLMVNLSGIKDALSNQSKTIRMISKNKDIGPEDKRRLIDGLYNGMIETAKHGNKMVEALDKSLAK